MSVPATTPLGSHAHAWTSAAVPAVVAAAGATAIAARALVHRDSLLTFAVLALVALLVAPRTAQRFHGGLLLCGLALMSVAGVLAVTVVPDGGYAQLAAVHQPVSVTRWWTYMSSGWGEALTGWMTGTDGPMNVALFAGPAALWVFVTRRPFGVVSAGVALTVAIETYQGLTGTRAAGPADLIANALGVMVGAGVASALLRHHQRRSMKEGGHVQG
jgi:hypothetical protein